VTTEAAPKKKSLTATSLMLLPAQIVLRAGEGLLPLLLAAWFGRSHATDVYYFCFAVFSFAGSLVFSAYQDSSLVPVLAEARLVDRGSVPRLLGAMLSYTLLVGGGMALVVAGAAAGYFSFKYEGEDRALALAMVAPFGVYLVALSVKTFFGAVLASEHKFFAPPIAGALGMVVALSAIYTLRARLGVFVIPCAQLAGELVAAVVLFFAVRAAGVHVDFTLHRPPALAKASRLIAAEVGGSSITRINPIVDQLMAGLAGVAGGATLLKYTFDVATVPTSLLQATLLSVLLSHLSDDAAKGDLAAVKRVVRRAMAACAAILGAAALLLWLVERPLLEIVFLRGAMDAAGVTTMVQIFPYALAGLPGFGVLLVTVRAHIAIKNSPIMIPMGILNAVSNMVFNVVLLRALGLPGIALSTSCMQMVVAMALWVTFERKIARMERGAA